VIKEAKKLWRKCNLSEQNHRVRCAAGAHPTVVLNLSRATHEPHPAERATDVIVNHDIRDAADALSTCTCCRYVCVCICASEREREKERDDVRLSEDVCVCTFVLA